MVDSPSTKVVADSLCGPYGVGSSSRVVQVQPSHWRSHWLCREGAKFLISGSHLLPQFPNASSTGLRSSPDSESEYRTVKGLVLTTCLITTPFSSRNLRVIESVFEFMPDDRMSSLKPFGPAERCLTTSNLDSLTIALIVRTMGHFTRPVPSPSRCCPPPSRSKRTSLFALTFDLSLAAKFPPL